jgi:hypothetical protein
MAKKKTSRREKQPNNPKKPRFTSKANLFYSEVVAPLEKAYRQAMKAKNYTEAEQFFKQIREAKEEHRLWLARKELVRIK